jgi:hypothetical protein
MMPDDNLDRMIEAMLRQPVSPPDRALTDRILAVTQIQPAPAFNIWAMFSGWQRAFAGAAICASLLAGIFSGWSGQSSYQDIGLDEDMPGLTYSPGEWGEGL